MVIVGVGGSLSCKKSKWRDLLNEEGFEDLRLREAIGDCCCYFFDSEGKISKGNLYDRRIGLALEEFSKVPSSIAIARGKVKKRAVLAVILIL